MTQQDPNEVAALQWLSDTKKLIGAPFIQESFNLKFDQLLAMTDTNPVASFVAASFYMFGSYASWIDPFSATITPETLLVEADASESVRLYKQCLDSNNTGRIKWYHQRAYYELYIASIGMLPRLHEREIKIAAMPINNKMALLRGLLAAEHPDASYWYVCEVLDNDLIKSENITHDALYEKLEHTIKNGLSQSVKDGASILMAKRYIDGLHGANIDHERALNYLDSSSKKPEDSLFFAQKIPLLLTLYCSKNSNLTPNHTKAKELSNKYFLQDCVQYWLSVNMPMWINSIQLQRQVGKDISNLDIREIW